MTRPARSVVAFVVLATAAILPSQAAAQAPFPGAVNIDGGWVPCSHPIAIDRGRGCNNPTPARRIEALPPAPPATPTQFDPDCQGINPYDNPDKAAECGRRPLPGASTPQFIVGHVYSYGYDQQRAVVLGLSTDRDGVQVVTFSWMPESGSEGVTAMRTPPQPGGRSPWNYIGKQ